MSDINTPTGNHAARFIKRIEELERENAALRKVLQDAEVLASYTREDGKRQWVTLGEWLRSGQCIVLMDLADIDTYRTKEGGAT